MVVQLDTPKTDDARERSEEFEVLFGEASLPVLEGVLPELTPDPVAEVIAVMPQEQFRRLMFANWPSMMAKAFGDMDAGQRAYMLDHVRGVLDDLEEKYAAANHQVANPT